MKYVVINRSNRPGTVFLGDQKAVSVPRGQSVVLDSKPLSCTLGLTVIEKDQPVSVSKLDVVKHSLIEVPSKTKGDGGK